MGLFNFTLYITEPIVDEDTAANMLFEAGCTDGLFGVSDGVYTVDFSREAVSAIKAITSAMNDVEESGIGSHVYSMSLKELVAQLESEAWR